jgi:FkbM family methyltransferase
MWNTIRRAASRVPVLGPSFKAIYLSVFAGEGRAHPIKAGPLQGLQYYRYRWSTPRPDLVETNWDDAAAGVFPGLIKGKRRFFDVGANWGFYVLLAHRHRDAGCEIVAFEPNPQSAKELKTQCELNGVGKLTVVQAALSDAAGSMEFVDTGSAIGQKLAVVNGDFPDARHFRVEAMTLDAAAERYGAPDLIKLDVEGAENLVMAGGRTVMTRHRPMLLVEVHGAGRSGEFYDLMERYGYRCTTPQGDAVTDRAYQHHVVCYPT